MATPIKTNHKISVVPKLSGKINLPFLTRLDITYTMNVVNQFIHASVNVHLITKDYVILRKT